jgi:hypothetical protein
LTGRWWSELGPTVFGIIGVAASADDDDSSERMRERRRAGDRGLARGRRNGPGSKKQWSFLFIQINFKQV